MASPTADAPDVSCSSSLADGAQPRSNVQPELPLELWLQIFDSACADDGTTSRSLAQASKELRNKSRFHRYHSVVIRGWRQLLAFENTFCGEGEGEGEREGDSVGQGGGGEAEGKGKRVNRGEQGGGQTTEAEDKDIRSIRNLYVNIEELYSVAYPPESWFIDEDSDLDSTYVYSEDENELFQPNHYLNGNTEDGARDETPGGAPADEEGAAAEPPIPEGTNDTIIIAPEPADVPLPDSESESESEADSDASSICSTSSSFYDRESNISASSSAYSLSSTPLYNALIDSSALGTNDLTGQSLVRLAHTSSPLRQLEFRVFSALRNILDATAHSLRVLTLCWSPSSSLFPESILPRLPELRRLAILQDPITKEVDASVYYKFRIKRDMEATMNRGCLFERLERVVIGEKSRKGWRDTAWEGLLKECRMLKEVKVMHYYVKYVPCSFHFASLLMAILGMRLTGVLGVDI